MLNLFILRNHGNVLQLHYSYSGILFSIEFVENYLVEFGLSLIDEFTHRCLSTHSKLKDATLGFPSLKQDRNSTFSIKVRVDVLFYLQCDQHIVISICS